MRHKFVQVLLLALVAALNANLTFAQATSTGAIIGTAADQSGAVIAGAEVTLTNKATDAVRAFVTNPTGGFHFDQVAAGPYSVKISKGGFASYLQSFELLVNQTVTISAALNSLWCNWRFFRPAGSEA